MRHLKVDEVEHLGRAVIDTFGGSLLGVIKPNELESAVMRHQSPYYENITDSAAALMESILVNHPFCDGNKRTAFAITVAFLDINEVNVDFNKDGEEYLVHNFLPAVLSDEYEDRYEAIKLFLMRAKARAKQGYYYTADYIIDMERFYSEYDDIMKDLAKV